MGNHGLWTTTRSKPHLTVLLSLPHPLQNSPSRNLLHCLSLVKALFGKLDPKVPLDAIVRACLTCSFFTLAQVGKFSIPSLDSFNPTVYIKHSDVRMAMDHHSYHIMVFCLPCMKCSREGKDVYCSANQESSILSLSWLLTTHQLKPIFLHTYILAVSPSNQMCFLGLDTLHSFSPQVQLAQGTQNMHRGHPGVSPAWGTF